MSLKFNYTFHAMRTQEVEKTEIEVRDDQEVKVVKKVKEEVPYDFAILKPGRAMKEEAEIFHAGLMNEYVINRGLMTRQQLIKRYANDGGSMSEPEKQKYAELYAIILREEENLQRAQINVDGLKEEEKLKRIEEITQKLIPARIALQEMISMQNTLYEHTAETKAEEKTVFWWVLKLAYTKKDGNWTPFFGGGEIKDRIAKYDEMEEGEDLFNSEIIKRFLWLVGMWYNGQISTEEDFKKVEASVRSEPPKDESK